MQNADWLPKGLAILQMKRYLIVLDIDNIISFDSFFSSDRKIRN